MPPIPDGSTERLNPHQRQLAQTLLEEVAEPIVEACAQPTGQRQNQFPDGAPEQRNKQS